MRRICLVGILFLVAGCGRSITAVEKACGWKTTNGVIRNVQGDSVSVVTIRQYTCS